MQSRIAGLSSDISAGKKLSLDESEAIARDAKN
jgi:hypothetical protein